MSFTLPGLLPWRFRIVLIGQQVVLEASSEGQQLSTVLEPGGSLRGSNLPRGHG